MRRLILKQAPGLVFQTIVGLALWTSGIDEVWQWVLIGLVYLGAYIEGRAHQRLDEKDKPVPRTTHYDDRTEQDRADMPGRCPRCGAETKEYQESGTMYVHGPADRRYVMEAYGIEANNGDTLEWVALNCECRGCGWRWRVWRG